MKKMILVLMMAIGTAVLHAADDIREPGWGFSFRLPAGWKCQHDANGAVLGHDTVPGLILVLPHTQTSLEQVRTQLREGLTEQGTQLALSGELKPLGKNAIIGDYRGTFNGETALAIGIGIVSTNGGGAYVIALSTPEKFGKEIKAAAETLAASVQVPKQDASDLARLFVGSWTSVSANSQTTLRILADGTYAYGAESSYSGVFRDSGGYQTGAWGAGGQDQKRGRWVARGTPEKGVFVLTSPSGETSTVEYKVHVEKGKTYWNEYYIDGKLYGRSGR